MKRFAKDFVTATLRRFDFELVSSQALQQLQKKASELDENRSVLRDHAFLQHLPAASVGGVFDLMKRSRSQIRQDLFVLHELQFKRRGFFVEFGATNGVDLSNTYLLEKDFEWTGILSEPANCWHDALARNRDAAIDRRCVWSRSGDSLDFAEVAEAELSTIAGFGDGDRHQQARADRRLYPVVTVSLVDLLEHHQAPRVIDYLSIDTEGSELEILSAFDFDKYRFRVITVEHNHTPAREKLQKLLESHGYRRKLTEVSYFDDWYVHPQS